MSEKYFALRLVGIATVGAVLLSSCGGSSNAENSQNPRNKVISGPAPHRKVDTGAPLISPSASQGPESNHAARPTVPVVEFGALANCKNPESLRMERKRVAQGGNVKVGSSILPIHPPGEIWTNSQVDGSILDQRREPGHSVMTILTPEIIYNIETRRADNNETTVRVQFACH